MKSAVLLLLATVVLLPSGAEAGCADAAAPGVEWRRCMLGGEDLRGVNLAGADLRSGLFNRADLSGADLREVRADGAKFISAELTGVRMDGAELRRADFTNAVLDEASLVEADLRNARLYDAKLRRANLTGAMLDRTDLLRADLSGATWTDGATVCAEGSIGRCIAGSAPAAELDDGS
ncbi:pentapeptide repeat-containing protein [Geminicoccus flavidas]|uniref:pentapeptide repeat-containing protein n=1 Tax=Geminicoccus flavidas TaxID=2506407 RepID=UPI001359E985|nr:pentapeptide repeat-containing protein [Geminicoccus flavidas]